MYLPDREGSGRAAPAESVRYTAGDVLVPLGAVPDQSLSVVLPQRRAAGLRLRLRLEDGGVDLRRLLERAGPRTGTCAGGPRLRRASRDPLAGLRRRDLPAVSRAAEAGAAVRPLGGGGALRAAPGRGGIHPGPHFPARGRVAHRLDHAPR